ncbi:Multiple C2 and transmembrane domain-containing protein [Eumeta japonica]|uniref:Multiple C2 and transmembrane domain-containing protein n=1 Tax=Eumeta variegata TaxID=151549 RepID=A0A4C1ZKG4_EUMVA|nr:Multiple C2 and transmembrane domain-containing protein [Eumeta japonica]
MRFFVACEEHERYAEENFEFGDDRGIGGSERPSQLSSWRLGTEIHKSKSVPKTEQPAWRERFNMYFYEDKRLEISVWHKGKQKTFIGRCTIDLSSLEKNRTHDMWCNLECGYGAVHLLLTLSGSPLAAPCDGIPTTYTNGTSLKPMPVDKYMWYNTSVDDGGAVGELRVTVHGARGLPLSALGARPLALCVLELDNARVQTHAARAAPDPLWNQTYTFDIMDITSTLEVSVQDQCIVSPIMGEALGKVCIPLLRINNGEKRWYALKDKTKKSGARGNCPRILLEMHAVWNPIKASLRLLTPKEAKYIKKQGKFDIPLIYSNLKFIKDVFHFFYDLNESINCDFPFSGELFEWDSVETSALALAAWLAICCCFRLWMAPLALLAPFLYNFITRPVSCASNSLIPTEDLEQESEESCTEAETNDKTIKNRLSELQDMTFTIKNGIDFIVSFAERIKKQKEWRELNVPEPNLRRMGSRRRPPI